MLEGSPYGSGVEVIERWAAFQPQHLDDFDQRGQLARAAQGEMKLFVDRQGLLEVHRILSCDVPLLKP